MPRKAGRARPNPAKAKSSSGQNEYPEYERFKAASSGTFSRASRCYVLNIKDFMKVASFQRLGSLNEANDPIKVLIDEGMFT